MTPFSMNNVMLTRKCNLTCDYCRIIRDYENRPKEYPSINAIGEVTPDKWISFGKWIKEHTDGFIVLFGGEPFVYNGLVDILKAYNDIGVAYSVTTNSTRPNEALELVKKGILKGISASVDPIIFKDYNDDKSRKLKSNKGLYLLTESKKVNPDVDAVAEVVLDKYNYKYLPSLIEELSKYGVWADITIIESPKNKYYDFAEECKDLLLSYEERQEVKQIVEDLVSKGYLIHAPEALYSVLEKGDDTRCQLTTSYHTSSIEPNGDLRLCYRIKGINTPRHNIFEYIEEGLDPWQVDKIIKESVKKDYEMLCDGCAWTCVHMPEETSLDKIKSH